MAMGGMAGGMLSASMIALVAVRMILLVRGKMDIHESRPLTLSMNCLDQKPILIRQMELRKGVLQNRKGNAHI
jgi:hypothetical protein